MEYVVEIVNVDKIKRVMGKEIFYYLLLLTMFYSCAKPKWVKLEREEAESCIQHFQLYDSMYKLYADKRLIYNEEIAVSVAEAYLFHQFGESRIKNEKPYKITMVKDNWVIEGNDDDDINMKTGSFFIVINSIDGKVLGMAHGK